MVCVGGEVSGVSVVCAFGVPEGGVERLDGGLASEEPSAAAVKMRSTEGPSGSMCCVTGMGMAGLRYFILGSISRQNNLFRDVSLSLLIVSSPFICPG